MSNNDQEPGDVDPPPVVTTWVAIIFEAALVLVALLIGYVVGIPAFGQMVATADAVMQGALATLPMMLLLWWGVVRPDSMIGQVARQASQVAQQLFGGASVPELFLVSLAAGFGEEALFRGVLQPLFANLAGDIAGLLVAAVLFGLAHALSPAYAVLATIIGIYFGWLFLVTGNLLVPIVAHALYDFLALLLLRQRASL